MRWATRAASRSLSPKRISLVATVSFSLTIGHDAEVEQPLERAAGVGVVGPARDVVGGEQHLADGDVVAAEGVRVGGEQGALADGGRRLLGREVAGAAR